VTVGLVGLGLSKWAAAWCATLRVQIGCGPVIVDFHNIGVQEGRPNADNLSKNGYGYEYVDMYRDLHLSRDGISHAYVLYLCFDRLAYSNVRNKRNSGKKERNAPHVMQL